MPTLLNTFAATVLRSLLRSKSLLKALLAYRIGPMTAKTATTAAAAAVAVAARQKRASKSLQEFLKEAEAAFLAPVRPDGLLTLSANLKRQFHERLQLDMASMLPSYSHALPTGTERGRYLALDVGGSTLRVALVELRGRHAPAGEQADILSVRTFRITKPVRNLVGMAFFEWMASRIRETISAHLDGAHDPGTPLPAALAWSFPLEQTSLAGGKLQRMGKAFLADQGLLGQDLGHIVSQACANQGLELQLCAILNDSIGCLLSRAYSFPSTRFSLILGTGLNMAAYLPVASIGRSKFGDRPRAWFDQATHVIVNTELGMFGQDILPATRWDRLLAKAHPRPHFQPLEQMVSGMYLGEVARLAILEAVETSGLLGGTAPATLKTPYSLDTDTLSIMESDSTTDLDEARDIFTSRHPSPHVPTHTDLAAIRAIASFVSQRSSALVATSVFTMWEYRLEAERAYLTTLPGTSPDRQRSEADTRLEVTTVAFNGGVIENYHQYLHNCQRCINVLIERREAPDSGRIDLVPAKESSLQGAAVALACVERHG